MSAPDPDGGAARARAAAGSRPASDTGTPGRATDATAPRLDPDVWRVAAVALLGPFMTQLDSTVVNVSLNTLRLQLHASIAAAQWIVTGYLLALALMLPLNGWLVDRVGAKRLYLGCFGAFTLASLLCGSVHGMPALIAARMLQGLAGGILAPMAQMMIARVAGRQMTRVLGYAVVPVLLAPILGPVLAGVILKYAGWSWLFYLNVPVGILGVGLAAWLLPRDEASLHKRRFDATGFVLISPALMCVLYGFQHASEHDGLLLLLAGLVLMGAFVRHALRKGGAALIDMGLFSNRVFAMAACTQFFSNGMLYARQLLIPLYLITGCTLSTGRAGALIAATGVGMMCSFPLVGRLTQRFGCRTVSAGGALLALLSVLPFFWMIGGHFSPLLTLVSLYAAGVGQGTISIPSVSAAYGSVPKEKLAVANTAINIVQRLGGPLATTAVAIAMSLATGHTAGGLVSDAANHASVVLPHTFTMAFIVLIALHALALWSASRLPASMPGASEPA